MQNFRLSYNNGLAYTDLFPITKIENIIPSISTSRDYAISVEIPPSNNLKQTIQVDIPKRYIGAQAFIELLYEKETDTYDYNTISQVNVVETGLEIIRLYRKPKGTIRVVVILNSPAKNFLKDSELDVVIPAYQGFVQTVSAPVTESQEVAPFYVELLTKGLEAQRAYASIAQIEAYEGKILIYRFGEESKTEIKVKLRFREGGI